MKADLHVHTNYSYDSISSPQETVKAALQKGLDCIAICDHGETRGAIEAIKTAFDKPILVIPGIEIKSKQGDILGLNIQKVIPNGLSAKETILEIKKAGGFVIIPHPFGLFCSFKGKLEDIAQDVDAIEVLNANIFGGNNQKALAWTKKNNLPISAGSDAHSPMFIGGSFLEIPGARLSISQIFEQIRNKRVRASGKEINIFMKGIAFLQRTWAKMKSIIKEY